MNCRNILLTASVAASFSLFSTEMQIMNTNNNAEDTIQTTEDMGRYEGVHVVYIERERPHTQIIHQRNQMENQSKQADVPQWEYRWCPAPYYENECDCDYCWCSSCSSRGCVSTISSGSTHSLG